MTPLGPVTHIVIHHSASPRTTTAADIKRWHEERGWHDIGYHLVIEGDARLVWGRPLSECGAHCPPNMGRVGICVVGDNTKPEHRWTEDQQDALERVVGAFTLLWPDARVCGHRDLRATECPGLEVADLWPPKAS